MPGKRTLAESLPGASLELLIAQARARGGAALEGDLRAALESALGTSLGDVTLHTSSDAAAAASAADADAFAQGNDVFFAAGRHDPATPEGRTLIAHEVAHTVQQRGATSTKSSISAPGDRHEVEADRFASSFVGGEPAAPVQTGSISRGAISRQAAGTRPPAPAPQQEPPDAFTIQPAQPLTVLGTTPTYRVPGARATPGGRYLCTWRVEPDPAANAPRQRMQFTPTWMTPMSSVPVRWIAEGHHKVHCDLRWERDQNAPAGRLATPPPPARHLELAVHVRAIEGLSRERFDDVAKTDAYFQARLTDLVPEAHAAQGGAGVDDPEQLRERRDRIRVQQENSDKIERGRQVICRAQLTIRANAQTIPLALAIGPARDERGKLILIDFTPNQRRMDYGTASSTADAIENLKNRNSYPAGLVEIDVPANESGVARHHATFETTGQSSLGELSSGLGTAGMIGMAAGGLALLASAPVSVPLLLIGGAIAGAGSAISLAERLHDAQPSARGIAIDALGVVSSVLGLGAVAAARAGVGTAVHAGRTMSVVEVTGRFGLAADAASFVLISHEALDEARAAWADTTRSESDRLQTIAGIIARVTAQGGLLVVSGSQTLRRDRNPAAAREPAPPGTARDREPPAARDAAEPTPAARDTPEPAPATREPTPAAARDPDAGAVPASVVRTAQSPQEVMRAMQDEKSRVIAGRPPAGRDGTWREHVDGETNFVRVIARGELESLIGRGQVTSRRVDALMRDPIAANTELMAAFARRDADGRLIMSSEERGASSGGRADPVIPISAFGPAQTGYTTSLMAADGQTFLVKFRQTVRRVASGNQDVRETEYFIPLWYRLEEVEWIADVRNNRWLWGGPGRAGTPEQAAALRRELGLDANPLAAPSRERVPMAPEVRREMELRALTRRTLDRAHRSGDLALRQEVNNLNERIEAHMTNVRVLRQRGDVDEELVAERLTAMERELVTLLDRLAARVGPRAR